MKSIEKRWALFYLVSTFLLIQLYFIFLPAQIEKLYLPVIPLLLPVLISSGLMYFLFKPSLSWVKWGKIDRNTLALTLALSVLAIGALIAWSSFADDFGFGQKTIQAIAPLPFWMNVTLSIPLFAFLMPAAEESLYRGITTSTLNRLFGLFWVGEIVQATIYAGFHYSSGFPNGVSGFILVFIYGMALGLLRRKSGGLLAPYISHVIVDFAIGYYLIFKFL